MIYNFKKYQTSPLFNGMDARDVTLSRYTDRVISPLLDSGKHSIEAHALEFYALNHLVGSKRISYHPEEPILARDFPLLDKYHEAVSKIGEVMAAYVLVICLRESRHRKGALELGQPEDHSSAAIQFFEQGYVHILNEFRKGEINCTLGEFVYTLVSVFDEGRFDASYGGTVWANIATHLLWYIEGELSTESFIDGCFHMQHNTGTIFNKDFIYSTFTTDFKVILDVQASGKIPNLLANPKSSDGVNFISPTYFSNYPIADFCAGFPPVDWSEVRNTRTEGTYSRHFNTTKSDVEKFEKVTKYLDTTDNAVDYVAKDKKISPLIIGNDYHVLTRS